MCQMVPSPFVIISTRAYGTRSSSCAPWRVVRGPRCPRAAVPVRALLWNHLRALRAAVRIVARGTARKLHSPFPAVRTSTRQPLFTVHPVSISSCTHLPLIFRTNEILSFVSAIRHRKPGDWYLICLSYFVAG